MSDLIYPRLLHGSYNILVGYNLKYGLVFFLIFITHNKREYNLGTELLNTNITK